MFTNIKDKRLVYETLEVNEVSSRDCDQKYVGQTQRSVKTTFE